jgi:hypothetical protein
MDASSLQLRAHLPPPTKVELEAASGSPEDYDDRNGYLPDFLGEGGDFLVPLPLPKENGDLVEVERAPKERPFETAIPKLQRYHEPFSPVLLPNRLEHPIAA